MDRAIAEIDRFADWFDSFIDEAVQEQQIGER
jgi:hypothetical protein